MASVSFNFTPYINRLLGQIIGFRQGEFELATGKHSIPVDINLEASRVWVTVNGNRTDGCGNHPINSVGVEIIDRTVVFHMDIQTETAKVEWMALA